MNEKILINYKKYIELVFPVICLTAVFINYKYFGYLVILYFFIREQLNLGDHITTRYKNFYLFFPLFFYLARFVYALSPAFNNLLSNISQINYFEKARFLDLQHLFLELYCNKIGREFTYIYKFDEAWVNSCPYTNFWGPLSKIIIINYDNIWQLTLLSAFIILFFLYSIYFKSYKKFTKNHDLLFFLSMSPPLNFLIDRMNVDIIIYLICFWIFKSNKQMYLKLTILILLSLYKIHPIFIIFGFVLYFMSKRDFKKFIFASVSLLISALGIFNFYTNNEFYTARPSELKWSFGLLSDAISINHLFNLNIYIIYFFLLLLILSFSLILKKNIKNNLSLNNFPLFVISVWFLAVSLYANHDFRIPLLFLIFFKLYEFKFNILNYSLMIFIFLSPPPSFSSNIDYSNIIQKNIHYIDLSFYFILSYLTLYVFSIIRSIFFDSKT